MKSLTKNSIFYTVYTVLNILFPLITSAYVARVILADGVGKVAYAQSIVSYFVLIACLGIPNYGLREIAKVKDDEKKKSRLFSELVLINIVSTTFAIILYTVIILIFPSLHKNLTLFIACGTLIVLNFFNIDWFYQGEEEYVYIVCRSIFIKVISIICLFLFVKKQEDYVLYAWILTCATGGNYIFNAFHSRKYVRICFKDIDVKKHLKPIFVFAWGTILSSIYANIDTTMLGIMTSDYRTGIYNYGHKIIQLLVAVCTSVTAVFLPRLSYYYTNDKEKFIALVNQGIRLLTFITIPMTAGIFIVSPEIIKVLYGSAFLESSITVRVFCVLIIIKGFGDLLCYQLISCTGNEFYRIPAVIIANVTNIILNFVLIPIFLENGAAIASVVSEIIVNLYQLRIVRRIIAFSGDNISLGHSIFGTGIVIVYCYLVKLLYLPASVSLCIMVGGGLAIYFTTNFLLHDYTALMIIERVKILFRK